MTIANTRANKSAVQNPVTENPGTTIAASSTRSALMTSEKSPRVTIVTGKVNTSRIGRINRLSAPSTTAAITAPMNVISTPGTTYAAIPIESAAINQCENNFIRAYFNSASIASWKAAYGYAPAIAFVPMTKDGVELIPALSASALSASSIA